LRYANGIPGILFAMLFSVLIMLSRVCESPEHHFPRFARFVFALPSPQIRHSSIVMSLQSCSSTGRSDLVPDVEKGFGILCHPFGPFVYSPASVSERCGHVRLLEFSATEPSFERSQAVHLVALCMAGLSINRNVQKHIATRSGVIPSTTSQCIIGVSALDSGSPKIRLKTKNSVTL